MANPDCKSCRLNSACRDSKASWVFFFIGVIATVALRIIEPIRVFNPLYGKMAWYVGVAGFLLFFIYKYNALKKTSTLIQEAGLKEKLASASPLSEYDYSLVSEIVCAQDNWKERTNYFVIFVLSAAALLFALWVDLA
ncbi:MAG: hypothetical protein V1744_07860 [Candidatus Altiarchaeota archaeon]